MINPRHEEGQGTLETMIMMSFLLLMVFGFVHFCMLATTKSMVNLAAFAAARTAMVQDASSLAGESGGGIGGALPGGIDVIGDAVGEAAGIMAGAASGVDADNPLQDMMAALPLKLSAGWVAAWQVIDNIRWWQNEEKDAPQAPLHFAMSVTPNPFDPRGATVRFGLVVTYKVPIGVPLFNGDDRGGGLGGEREGIDVAAFAPMVYQNVPEDGDNAR